MKHIGRALILWAAISGLVGTAEVKQRQQPVEAPKAVRAMPVCGARRTVIAELGKVRVRPWFQQALFDIKIRAGEIEFYADTRRKEVCPPGSYNVDLKSIGVLSAGMAGRDGFGLEIDGKKPFSSQYRRNPGVLILGYLVWNTAGEAQAFADAMNRLRAYARLYDPSTQRFPRACGAGEEAQSAAWRDFAQQAAAWRALPVKPPIPEEVRQHRVLAEHDFSDQKLESAVEHYESGLEIDALWPEGHFNAALLYAELKDYDDAVWHMRSYVELVPDARDARQARDQMVIWQDKLRQQTEAAPAPEQLTPPPRSKFGKAK